MKLRLIDDWHRSWKFASVQIAGAAAVIFAFAPDFLGYLGHTLLGTWALIPDDLKAALPEGMARWVAVGAFVLVMVGRVFQFERKQQERIAQDEHRQSD